MRSAIALFLTFSSFVAFADAVRWGGASLSNGKVDVFLPPDNYGEQVDGATLVWQSEEDGNGNYEYPYFYLHGDFAVNLAGDTATIKGVNHVAAYSTYFVQMNVGDTINLLTTFYADEVFYAYGWRPGDVETAENHRYSGDYDISVSALGEQVFYLGFGLEGDGASGTVWLYGWLEIAANGTELSIVNSAIGLNGQSMVVGAIPEPTGVSLLLLGLAPLMLRRSRG